MSNVARPALAEFLGTAFLLATVVGSGIMGVKLANGNDAIALLANTIATGGALIALITTFAPISGAHFNPAVSLFEFFGKRLSLPHLIVYIAAQLVGAIAGVLIAHAMFDLPLLQESEHSRATSGELLGEIIATMGLLLTIWSVARHKPDAVPTSVAAYIVAAYWFTSSTSFANPAVTLARSLTDTFSGIAPGSIGNFLAGQSLGLALALLITYALTERKERDLKS